MSMAGGIGMDWRFADIGGPAFASADAFNSDVSGWDTSRVTTFYRGE